MKQNVTFEAARNIIKVLLGFAAVLCLIALAIGEEGNVFCTYAAIAAIVCIAASIFVLVTCLKCPYCGKVIVRKCLVVKACPHCGRNLVSGLKSKKSKR